MADRPFTLLPASLLALLLAAPAALAQAQEPAAQQQQEQEQQPDISAGTADAEDFEDEPEIIDSLQPEPETTGVRSPESVEENDAVDLYRLLSAVRRAPPGLDGQPIQRPNAWASEPETEMAPQQPRDPILFPDDFIE